MTLLLIKNKGSGKITKVRIAKGKIFERLCENLRDPQGNEILKNIFTDQCKNLIILEKSGEYWALPQHDNIEKMTLDNLYEALGCGLYDVYCPKKGNLEIAPPYTIHRTWILQHLEPGVLKFVVQSFKDKYLYKIYQE
jgi:hypothetical protein